MSVLHRRKDNTIKRKVKRKKENGIKMQNWIKLKVVGIESRGKKDEEGLSVCMSARVCV